MTFKELQSLKVIILIIPLILLNSIHVCGEQRFVETPPIYQEVSSGDDVQLRCRIQDKRGQCIWQKDRKPVGMHPDKYEWASGRGSDCSLLIRRASLDFDDGFWECQVTSGDFTRQDALTSLPSRLLVRVKPRKPRLEYGGTILSSALTLREGQEVTISCVSKYGNPAAVIKWYIGVNEAEALRKQTNATEVDSPKTWAAHSLLRIRGQREYHGLPIRCITLHPSSPVPTTAETRLDVHYLPAVKLEISPVHHPNALEDSISFVSLRCLADANPAATVKWFRDTVVVPDSVSNNVLTLMQNRSQLNGTTAISELRFQPIKRDDTGVYSCKAVNVIGESEPSSYKLNVQYSPILRDTLNKTDVDIEETTLLGRSVELFECPEFEANPPAEYKWIHLRGGIVETVENREQNANFGKRLRLENIMWSDEGDYRCIAFNVINGVRRETPSEVRYTLHVTGPPEIQTRPSSDENGFYESVGWSGEPVHRLKSRFCSRPPPRLVTWQWGSSHIRAGESIQPKYEALPLEPIIENNIVTNCYWAKLEIKSLQKEDARIYTLIVESEKGRDSTNLKLIVRNPIELRVIAVAAVVGSLLILLLISIGIYSVLRMKHRRYHHEEEGSIAADAFYSSGAPTDHQKSVNSSHNKTVFVKNTDNLEDGLAAMYDYNQAAKETHAMSPEALKVRRAPAVLQPPTIV